MFRVTAIRPPSYQSLESIDQPCLLHLLVFVDLGHPDFVLETCRYKMQAPTAICMAVKICACTVVTAPRGMDRTRQRATWRSSPSRGARRIGAIQAIQHLWSEKDKRIDRKVINKRYNASTSSWEMREVGTGMTLQIWHESLNVGIIQSYCCCCFHHPAHHHSHEVS